MYLPIGLSRTALAASNKVASPNWGYGDPLLTLEGSKDMEDPNYCLTH